MLVICSNCNVRISTFRRGDPPDCTYCEGGSLVPQGQPWSITCADCGHVMNNDLFDSYGTMRCGCGCHSPGHRSAPAVDEPPPPPPPAALPPKLKPSKAAKFNERGPRPTKRGR